MARVLMGLLLVATAGLAQSPSAIQPYHKVGDTLRYVVVFDGNPSFSSVTLYFSTPGAPPRDQAGLRNGFGISQTRKLGPGKFEVEGVIPADVISGSYLLTDVQPRISPSGVKDYDAKVFHLVLEVNNPAKYHFPPLKSVAPEEGDITRVH